MNKQLAWCDNCESPLRRNVEGGGLRMTKVAEGSPICKSHSTREGQSLPTNASSGRVRFRQPRLALSEGARLILHSLSSPPRSRVLNTSSLSNTARRRGNPTYGGLLRAKPLGRLLACGARDRSSNLRPDAHSSRSLLAQRPLRHSVRTCSAFASLTQNSVRTFLCSATPRTTASGTRRRKLRAESTLDYI